MEKPKGSADEAIGRPSIWREGRYEQAGNPVDSVVNDPSQEVETAPDELSTPVTQRDYSGDTPAEPAAQDGQKRR